MSVPDGSGGQTESIELTASQERMLRTLVNRHWEIDEPVKGKEIASRIDRRTGTIRNQMQRLKRLGLVDGVAGPTGGYEPTSRAFDVLGMEGVGTGDPVSIRRDGDRVESAGVVRIDLSHVHHPDSCRARVRVTGGLDQFDRGDAITIGPLPHSGLELSATVSGTDSTTAMLMVRVEEMATATE